MKKEDIEKTQILELTRQMKFNFEEKKNENSKSKNKWVSKLNIIGEKEGDTLTSINYYVDAVMNELENISSIPKSFLETGGLKIYTTLDQSAMNNLEENIDK